MKTKTIITTFLLMLLLFSCRENEKKSQTNIIFLHHSVGKIIWDGFNPSPIVKAVGKVSTTLADFISPQSQLPLLFEKYNGDNQKDYYIKELIFPKSKPYGWNNFPFDYYNIWVKNAGEESFMEEPTLEMLTKEYQVIIFKHCFPVSYIKPDQDSAEIDSDIKTVSIYKLQYLALREKLHEFPRIKFILFTGASQVKNAISEESAERARSFFTWVTNEWDIPDDNIFIWDFYKLQTEGGLYFKDVYAISPNDPHPNEEFAQRIGELLFKRIIDVLENDGYNTTLTGEKI